MAHHHYEDVIDTDKKINEKEAQIEQLRKEQEVIRKKQEIKNKKAHNLSMKLQKLKELRDKTEGQIIETTLELNKLCTHERIRTENRNYAGGYLDRAEYWTDYFCEICGVKVDEKVEYGGFA